MSNDEFMKQQYLSLRAEISDSTSRIFKLLVIGMLLVLVSGYLASANPTTLVNAAIPFMLLAIVIAFINEQNNINRAGKYLREVIEPTIPDVVGWEHWLSTKAEFREADRAYFVGFSIFFFIFFVISASLTLANIEKNSLDINQLYFWSTAIAYALSAVCVVVILVRHWRSSTIL